ncbi:glycosyltransferase family 1 protein [Bacillus sp. HMF5848]|uniref:beta 1-4 rhamnosyltransferase Cps2T n=1 Tax=Bacillus sp. HMF5848 TaxID=2495421 RepID=UPI000F794DD3|nr:DUF1972 domain-containing protein [Bacillus sp. HMF5848]RSK28862.1 glycosyltransferase family 1 protein [Bacillus sp. HMF5848]
MKNIFIIGSKGIPSNYGGFETFVDKLTLYKKSENIKYHVSCLSNNNEEFEYNGARCFNVKTPEVGPAKAVLYDIISLQRVYDYIVNHKIQDAIVYILACRVGPFIKTYKNKFDNLSIPLYVNPDGHEWKRAKWNWAIRKYWKYSERLMVKNSDLLICDSVAIQKYIIEEYRKYKPKTTYIAYGATINKPEHINVNKYRSWLKKWSLKEKEYYLIVGRFVEENNYETIIREFMRSKTSKSLVIVTNVEKNKFYKKLKDKTRFDTDKRIKFVGTIYEQELIYQVRKGGYGYLHGHEVGGTNPSLLEAMATTPLNLLLDVEFNREVAHNAALYFGKEINSLMKVIQIADNITDTEIVDIERKAKIRILEGYSWDSIVFKYEKLFLGE